MKSWHILQKLLCVLLTFSTIFTSTAFASSPPALTLSDPNEQVITENIEVENILTENRLTEFITEEIYLDEIILAEDKIVELLLEEDIIDEVFLCQTIYIPQECIMALLAGTATSMHCCTFERANTTLYSLSCIRFLTPVKTLWQAIPAT